MLEYDPPLWRPPSEARSLILQVTLGCSFNRCSFCSMYREKEFRVRPLEQIFTEIEGVAAAGVTTRKVFLADGDALACDTGHLLEILGKLSDCLPDLMRVSCYALPLNLVKKTEAELRALREAGLQLVFYGIESGSRDILKRITKGATPEMMIAGISKAHDAGIKVSATVVLGLGGKSRWQDHMDGTIELVNAAPLNFLSTLQLGLDPSIAEEFMKKFGEPFEPQDDLGMLAEQRRLIDGARPPRPVIFRSNHASNALALAGTLPKDRAGLLANLDAALEGKAPLRPPFFRGY